MSVAAIREARKLNLIDRINEVSESLATADPKVIADEVLARINTRDAVTALEQCLPHFVTAVITRRHVTTDAKGRRGSWRVEGALLYKERLLREPVNTSSGWKLMAECTREDLLYAAGTRRQSAADLLARAEWFEKVAAVMAEHDAATVAALPEPVLVSLATDGQVAPE